MCPARLKIHVVTPKPPGSGHGNAVSASRFQALFTELGHAVTVESAWSGHDCDVLVALHARRSHPSIADYRRSRPNAPLVVVLTGTDLYSDLPDDPDARRSLVLADRLVALQQAASRALDPAARGKLSVIEQSAVASVARKPTDRAFQVAMLSHIRPVKDPLRPALAARLLPAASRIVIHHAGMVIDPALGAATRVEMAENPRYRWLGELDHAAARALLAESHALALPSRLEGGANAVSEAIAFGVPVIGSRIDGSLGLLGDDYRGFHPFEDTRALADLLWRAESDADFYRGLEAQVAARQYLVDPARERRLWSALLTGMVRSPVGTTRARGSA